jgi:hypothetical protein
MISIQQHVLCEDNLTITASQRVLQNALELYRDPATDGL